MKNVLLLLSVLGCLSSVYGQKVNTTLIGKQQTAIFNRPTYDYSIKAPKTIDDNQDFQSLDITSKAGNLAGALGDNIYNVDSLVVRGSINDTDIHTLWEASFKGRLSVINLENAEIENGIVPEDAFWHQKEQLDPSWEFINTIHLRRIILPYGVKRIEEGAFSYCINLEEVNIPSSLQYLGTYAFSDCVSLKTDPLVFPEGFERFGNLAFMNCRSLTGTIVLPSTIKEIGDGVFFYVKDFINQFTRWIGKDWRCSFLRLPFERGMDSKFMPNDSRYQYFSTELSSEKNTFARRIGKNPQLFC